MIGKNLTFWRYLSGISILIDISFEMNTVYDLIIVGAGCLGVAAAQYASSIGQSVCLIESQQIDSETRYWSSSFSARQNRVQYSEEYLTRYVVESNKYWKEIEK
jgi:glycine/D-amino acid oxidase-like deaminating enzyme